ncbi:MAG: excalibur calcium-binding domain-containing protein [Solirubrobacterales bacterium]
MRIRLAASAAIAALAGVLLVAPSPPQASAVDFDCADFPNQAAAQEYLLPGDPHRLDADSDGIACEDLPCPCSVSPGENGPGPAATPMPPPPYRLAKADARRAALKVAREFARSYDFVTTAVVGECRRRAHRRIDCFAVDRGESSSTRTVCHLRIAVRASNRHPYAELASSNCQTTSILKLTAARARAELDEMASEIAGKPVAVEALERASASSFHGIAHWTRPGATGGGEKCTAIMEATLRSPNAIQVFLGFFSCEPG